MAVLYDYSNPLVSTLTSSTQSPVYQAKGGAKFNVSIWGTFSATLLLQRSFDVGVTWLTCAKPDLTDASFTAAVSFLVEEPQSLVQYRLNCTYVSGTVNYRIGGQ